MKATYDLEAIKFGVDEGTFERAVKLYESGKVTKFRKDFAGYSALVLGGSPYEVSVSASHYDRGNCTCYLGQEDTLCKHMIAVAIMAVAEGKPLSEEDKQVISVPTTSGKLGTLSKSELADVKKSITAASRYIKAYNGPSRTWFAYQNSLQEGSRRLAAIVSGLPVCEETTELLVALLLRLDDKLCREGVDDSDGTVGNFMTETVAVLMEYARLDPACRKTFRILKDRETCFGWEEPLIELIP